MTPERWQQVKEILHGALQKEPAQRSAYLNQVCQTDPSLQRDVESLLASGPDLAEDFLKSAPPERLPKGVRLGPYEIVNLLGAGGMGEVYCARDSRLGRNVALKVIPASYSSDPARRQRFQREARAISALQHPNICTLYDVGQQDGTDYLVMEYLEGETLSSRLTMGALKVEQILAYGIEIASALDAAHKQNIIHRDLKPGNILITSRGECKVLDFGLAKLGADEEAAPTVTEPTLLSSPGVAMGTVPYMSPEQALGKTLDSRTDLFSLGAVLYEMATGSPAFSGGTAAAAFDAILHKNPVPAAERNALVPVELDRIIFKALEKDRDLRYQSPSEFCADLKRLRRDAESGRTTSVTQSPPIVASRKATTKVIAALLVLLLVIAAVTWWSNVRAGPPKLVGSSQITNNGLPKGRMVSDGVRLYFQQFIGGIPQLAEVSANGGDVVPVSSAPLQNPIIFDLSRNNSELLIGSHPGEGLDEDMQLWTMPIPAGVPRRLAGLYGHDGCWTTDGTHLVYANGADLFLALADGSENHKLLTLPGPASEIRFSPDGKRLRFTVTNETTSIWETTAEGKDLHAVLNGKDRPENSCCGSWSPDGNYYYFAAADNIWVLPGRSLIFHNRVGDPSRLTNGPLSLESVIPSADGKRLFVTGVQSRVELVTFDIRSKEFAPFLGGISGGEVDFSRDRQWATYVTYPKLNLWRSRLDGSEKVQLTAGLDQIHQPRWSPDGKQIVFTKWVGNSAKMYLISAEGATQEELKAGEEGVADPTWSPDGKSILFGRPHATNAAIFRLNLNTRQISKLPGSDGLYSPRWSADGHYIAALTTKKANLMLYDFDSGMWTQLAEGYFGFNNWSRDSRYVYALHEREPQPSHGSEIVRIHVADHKMEHILDLKDVPLNADDWAKWTAPAADGSVLLMRDRSVQEIYALPLLFP